VGKLIIMPEVLALQADCRALEEVKQFNSHYCFRRTTTNNLISHYMPLESQMNGAFTSGAWKHTSPTKIAAKPSK
jgi:hypothetical protein